MYALLSLIFVNCLETSSIKKDITYCLDIEGKNGYRLFKLFTVSLCNNTFPTLTFWQIIGDLIKPVHNNLKIWHALGVGGIRVMLLSSKMYEL